MPQLASISLDVAMEGDVVQDLTHAVFIISKIFFSTKPMVISKKIYDSFVSAVAHCTCTLNNTCKIPNTQDSKESCAWVGGTGGIQKIFSPAK